MPDKVHVSMTQADLKSLMEDAITGAFVKIGISADNPIEMQKDMAFIRALRTGAATMRIHGLLVGVGLLVSALGTCIWIGFKVALGHK